MNTDITVHEARQLEEAFLSGLNNAQDAYERIVQTKAWTALGYDTFADWWDQRVRPIMRALSMRPTREIAAAVIEQVRQEEADLPPTWRRTQQQLAEMVGLDRRTASGWKPRQDRPEVQNVPADDLGDVPITPDGPRWCKYCYGEHEFEVGDDGSILVCTNCGAGVAPTDDVVAAGGYDAWMDQITERFVEDFRPQRAAPKRQPVMLTLRTHTGEEVQYPKPAGKATFNETTGDGISWAAWSWNPVTGCLHGCDYCYARAIAHRFPDGFPAGFTPLFHEERLDAPLNTTVPAAHRGDPAWKRVFVCSMADLYGRWVPDEWIHKVHDAMMAAPWWQYILLTKFPSRYVGLDIPPKAWVGTSVDEQKRVRIAQDAMAKLEGRGMVRWLSLEPLREPLEFDDLSMFDWIVIGAQTETRQPDGIVEAFAPPFEWVARLVAQAREAGCKVHLKPNLVNGRPGMTLPDEYPGEA